MYNVAELQNKYGELFVRQMELEEHYKGLGAEAMKKAYQNAKEMEDGLTCTKLGQRFISLQYQAVYDGVKVFLETALAPHCGTKAAYTALIEEMNNVFSADREQLIHLLTFSTLSNLFNGTLTKITSHSILCQWIARELYNETRLQAFKNHLGDEQGFIDTGIDKRVGAAYRTYYVVKLMEHRNYTYTTWNKKDSLQFAASLIQVVLKACDYFEESVNSQNILEIVATQKLLDAWQVNEQAVINNSYKFCPTVIPPIPWQDVFTGGYYGALAGQHDLLRLRKGKDVYAKKYVKKLGQLELEGVRKAINAVQATPWKINKEVLAVLSELVKRGGGVAGIPQLNEVLPPHVLPEDHTDEQKLAFKKDMARWHRSEKRRKSIALRALSNIRIAEEFKDFERIYFPCNMDFRGRVYPIPPFNFQGDDVNKSLLLFADVPPCEDEASYDWFMVEGANLAGYDKASYEDRIAWIKEREAQILDVVKNPLGNLWWADMDSPCQFLAWCFEYGRLVEHIKEHGSIKGFITGINVAFDGTCSGLQHFSAILRDPVGGKAVNLIPGEKPSDIYGIVAEKVNKVLAEDVMHGTLDETAENKRGEKFLKYGTRTLAEQWTAYGVTRKVTKRSVMTLAYGSKEYGFRDQLLDDIIKPDKDANGDASVFADSDFQAAGYLAKLIWDAVGTTVIAAVEGMKWLQACARKVTKNGQVVCWCTPMGLPVQQAYMKQKNVCVQVRCAGKRIRIYDNEDTGEIDSRSQASGIAPNFIHSMDAAHLQLTICNCVDAGLVHFAMIHDSYGTTVAQAQKMYQIVRESFIQMYTENDVFVNFKNDMQALTDEKLPELPNKGSLDINVVRDSKYIFS